MLYALIALCGILSFISVRNPFYPLKWLASFAWWGLVVYWTTNPVETIAKGTPTDVIILMVFIMAALLFMIWGLAGRKGKVSVEEQYDSTGGYIGRILKGDTDRQPKRSNSLTNSSNLEYRRTVRKALHKKR